MSERTRTIVWDAVIVLAVLALPIATLAGYLIGLILLG